jgi:lipoprotein-releasing system permease protein
MSEYDQTFIFMPLMEAQLFFGIENAVQGIELMVTQPDQVALGARSRPGRRSGARLIDWQQMNSSLFGALTVERNVMFLILTMIILVAALNIISGLIMLVKDKGGDIAILRTMGATQGAVMRVFFIAGASIGVSGRCRTLIGVVFCANIENIRQFLSRSRHDVVRSDDLFPESDAGENRSLRRDLRGADGAIAFVSGHAASLLARGKARSGGSAPL